MLYPFEEMIGLDAYTRDVAPGSGQVFALADLGFSTPLPTVDVNGLPVELSVDPETGFLPSFNVEGHTEVRFKSGDFTKVLVTTRAIPGGPGDPGPAGPPPEMISGTTTTVDPEYVAFARVVPAGEGKYRINMDIPRGAKGDPGDRGLPGLEAMPQAEGMAQHILTPGPVQTALNAQFVGGVVSSAPPVAPMLGTVWISPQAPPVPLVSPIDTDVDLLARWEVSRLNGTDGQEVTKFNRTAGSWGAATLTGATGPTFTADGLNGRPTLKFDGVDDYLNLDHEDITGPSTLVTVAKLNTWGIGRIISSISSDSYRAIRASSRADQLGILTPGTGAALYAPWTVETGWMIIVAVIDTTSRIYLNSRTPLISNAPQLAVQRDLRLFRGPGSSTQYSEGELGDHSILNRAISDTDAQRFMDELEAKHRIELGA